MVYNSDAQLKAACGFFSLIYSKNIKLYFLFFTNEINIFAIREILLLAENGPLKMTQRNARDSRERP